MLGAILFASAIISSQVFAYNYINSTQFIRMPARSATIDSPDAVYYNPAGLVKIKDGFYTEIGNTFVFKEYSHKYFKASYTDNTPVLFSMFGYIIYKKDKAALFVSNWVPEGGGMSDYRNPFGIQTINFLQGTGLYSPTTPSYVHAYKFWVTIATGGSYALTDWLAITAGLRTNIFFYEQVVGFMKLGSVSKETHRAHGVSGWGGLMISPVKEFAVTAIYASEAITRGTITDKKLHYSHIAEERLPAYVGLGVIVKPHEKVNIQLSYQVSFTEQKNYGNSRIVFLPATGRFAQEFSFSYSDQFEPKVGTNIQDYKGKLTHAGGIGAEFQVTEKLMVSCGLGFESAWLNPRAQNPLDPKLASIVVGAGFKYKYSETGSVDIGALKNTYFKDEMMYGLIKLNKNVWAASICLSTKWM
jgi:long-subunit fatty acid transport protein